MSIENGHEMVELKQMVMSFRVSELQVLLGSAGRNKSGRKHDLLSRSLQLLKSGCTSQIQQRIRELYRQRFPRSKTVQPSLFSMPDISLDYNYRHDKKALEKNDFPKLVSPPVHPDVKFKGLPFYEVISDVVKPSSLITRPHREYSRADFTFTLSEDQVLKIRESQMKDASRKRYQIQVQLRFCLLETTCDQKDFIPPNLCVQVNRQMVQLPAYIPPSKAGIEPRRANRPIDITMCCRLCDTLHNRLEITWMSDNGKNFATCVNVVRPLSSETLLQGLRRKGIRNSAHSHALIKEKLERDPDSEIATTSLKVSLLCPLGKMRMTVPARPLTCTHMQCFDAMLFLQMNEKKPTWICPVCDKPSDFSDLFIDGLFMEILSETSSEEVIFLEDGRWEPVKPKTEYLSLCTPSKPIALDLSNSPNSSVTANGDPKRKEPIIIDLTGDTSDEDEEPTSLKHKNDDREQDEVHSLSSSTSPYRSDTASVHRDDAAPLAKQRRTSWDLTGWDPARDLPRPPTSMPSGIFNPATISPRPSSFGQSEVPDRIAPPALSHTPGYSVPGSRDNTPPLHTMQSLLNPGSLAGFPRQMDFNQLEYNYPFLLDPSFGSLRRVPADHSPRSSPYLINSSSSHLYPPPPTSSRSSGSEHLSGNYMTSYPVNPFAYSPISFLRAQDNSDVIPID